MRYLKYDLVVYIIALCVGYMVLMSTAWVLWIAGLSIGWSFSVGGLTVAWSFLAFFHYIFPYTIIAAGPLFIGTTLYRFIHSFTVGMKGCLPASINETCSGTEPAYRQYFFKKAYLDFRDITVHNWKLNQKNFLWLGFASPVIGLSLYLVSIVNINLVMALSKFFAVIFGLAIVPYCVVTIIHMTIIILVCICGYIIALIMRMLAIFNMVIYRIFNTCKHCHERFSIPIYVCQYCFVEHNKLVPGSFGVFSRRCKCSNKIPTMFFLGRGKLKALCPKCKMELTKGVGEEVNKHFAIIGAQSSGKSTYLISSLWKFKEDFCNKNKIHFQFSSKQEELMFQLGVDMLIKGQGVQKTVDFNPTAFNLSLRKNSGKSRLLYIYDSAGEAFEENESFSQHTFHKYVHGIILIVDPFAQIDVQNKYGKSFQEDKAVIQPGLLDAFDILGNLIESLEEIRKIGAGKTIKIPLAVIVNKADAYDLKRQLDLDNIDNEFDDKYYVSKEAEKHHNVIRETLISWNMQNFVNLIERRFSNFRFFAVSSLGRMPNPNDNTSFCPKRVVAPLVWLMYKAKVF